jgi:hypothetical protein
VDERHGCDGIVVQYCERDRQHHLDSCNGRSVLRLVE